VSIRTPKRKNKKKQRRKAAAGTITTAESAFVAALLNPFGEKAKGGKIPDFNSLPTVSLDFKASVTLASSSGGYLGQAFYPLVNSGVWSLGAGGYTGGTLSWASPVVNSMPNWSTATGFFDLFRPVAWGIKITAEQSIGTAQGHIYVSQMPYDVNNGIYGTVPTTEQGVESSRAVVKVALAELANNPLYVSAKIQDSAICIFRDEAYPSVTSTMYLGSSGWPLIMVYIAGAVASTNVINVEYICHVEAIPQMGAAFIGEGMPCPYNTDAMNVVSQVNAIQPAAFLEDQQSPDLIDSVMNTMDKIIANGPRIANFAAQAYHAGKVLAAGVTHLGRYSPYLLGV